MKCQPTPVIVIGMTRSGTKWLSNILCNHSEMIGVQSEQHGGIIETNMFHIMPRKFNLSFADDYIAFIESSERGYCPAHGKPVLGTA